MYFIYLMLMVTQRALKIPVPGVWKKVKSIWSTNHIWQNGKCKIFTMESFALAIILIMMYELEVQNIVINF